MPDVGIVSYLACAVLFAVFALAVATVWRGRLGGKILFLAAVVNALWAAEIAWFSSRGNAAPLGILAVTDIARGGVWMLLMWHLVRGPTRRTAPRTLRLLFHGTWAGVVTFSLLAHLYLYATGQDQAAQIAFIVSGFLLAVTVLVLVEQFYRNSPTDYRWEIKFFCFAVGGIFVYDIYLFANGLLFMTIDAELWQARGAVNALALPFSALSLHRTSERPTESIFSRRMVFYSTGMLGVGLYLLIMAAGGYMVRIYGGTWGNFAQILFLSGALFLLAVVLFSGQARARVRVFLDKHFFDYRYDYRVEWLNLTHMLSDSEDGRPLEQRAIAAIAGPLDCPGGALWRRRDDHYVLSSTWNTSVPGSAVERDDGGIVAFFREREWIVDLVEFKAKRSVYGELALPDWLTALDDAWLLVPLFASEDLLGFVMLTRSRAMRDLTWEDHDLLRTVGRQVGGHLALDESVQLLSETRQFQVYHQLTAFLMHDIKNLIAQQSLVVKNAARHKDNPAFIDDVIVTVDNSVKRMQRLLEQLRQGGTATGAQYARVGAVCREVVKQNAQREPRPRVELLAERLRVAADPEELSMVLGHLVRNAQEATPPDGSVTLVVSREDDRAIIEIRDTGSGMSEEFMRERLFKPFDTTKGVKGMGIGVYQAREFMRAAGGTLEVESQTGEGSVFRAGLPLAPSSEPEPTGMTSGASGEREETQAVGR